MTAACIAFLSLSLLLYLAATLFSHAYLVLKRPGWDRWGRRALIAGAAVNAVGMALHFVFSHQGPFTSLLPVVALLVIATIVAGLLAEHYLGARHLSLFLAPLAFLALLYPVLMPVQVTDAESVLVRYPWLGIHVALTMLGDVGFAVAFCSAVIYLLQARMLKRGRLNHFLPALDSAARVTYSAVGAGFAAYTLGLLMGVIWLFGAPGELLGKGDAKILMALPTWVVFAVYLYLRGLRRQHGRRLKWLVILGFALGVANLMGVRHDFDEAELVSPAPAVQPAYR
ncbi:MAG: cytochrome c biogenesis protein CcsA [Gemmatimonadota bacterium]